MKISKSAENALVFLCLLNYFDSVFAQEMRCDRQAQIDELKSVASFNHGDRIYMLLTPTARLAGVDAKWTTNRINELSISSFQSLRGFVLGVGPSKNPNSKANIFRCNQYRVKLKFEVTYNERYDCKFGVVCNIGSPESRTVKLKEETVELTIGPGVNKFSDSIAVALSEMVRKAIASHPVDKGKAKEKENFSKNYNMSYENLFLTVKNISVVPWDGRNTSPGIVVDE